MNNGQLRAIIISIIYYNLVVIISSLVIKRSILIKSNRSTTYITNKMSNLIDGNAIAAQIRLELNQRVTEMKETLGMMIWI